MSTLHIPVTTIDELKPHTNADALDIAVVGGWQCVVKKDEYQAGDKVVYFPPDTVLPEQWIEHFGVGDYTSKGRIRQARLRGEPSFGLVVKPDDPSWEVGQDVADYYGATKYEPPPKVMPGDSVAGHPLFPAYTEVENLRSFPDVFVPGEPVAISEKIDGTNVRLGIVEGQRMAGSRKLRRAEPEDYKGNTYWFPWTLPEVAKLLAKCAENHTSVVLYGEVYGRGIQKLHYGQKGVAFAAFDLLLDGQFVGIDEFLLLTRAHGVATVPYFDVGQTMYSLDMVRAYASGKATIGGDHIREGVVVKPVEERTDPKLGRVILKYVSDEYLLKKKDKDDFTDM